jgi:hypothetical protein
VWSLNVGVAILLATYYNGNGRVGANINISCYNNNYHINIHVVMTMANLV